MRYLFGLSLIILLVSCAKTNGYYTKSAQNFEGKNVQFLIEKMGPPDHKMIENGNTIYAYKTEDYRTYNPSYSPSVGITQKGGPLLVSPAQTESVSLLCFTAFVVNQHGIIVDIKQRGNGC